MMKRKLKKTNNVFVNEWNTRELYMQYSGIQRLHHVELPVQRSLALLLSLDQAITQFSRLTS